jgi:general secretion pathway protein D
MPDLRFPRFTVWAALLAALLTTACADQRYRTQARDAMALGAYEEALGKLQEGVNEHPDSVALRAGLIQTRQEVAQRLTDEVQRHVAQGDTLSARRALERAVTLDPGNPRLRALRTDLELDARQRGILVEARGHAEAQRPDLALRAITQGLQDNPRHPELLALRRKLEDEARAREQLASRMVLAQSKPISLDFREAGLRTVLDLISRHSGVNYVVDRDVRADLRVSLLLQDAQVEDALDLLLASNQLTKKVVDARTILVYPNTPEKAKEYQEQVVRVFYLTSGEARGAAGFLRSMLKVAEPFVDERSNMLALRDSPDTIRMAERLIALYDAGEPEVLLELEVLEVNTRRLTELGVKLPDSFSLSVLPPTGTTGLTLDNIANLGRNRIGVGVGGVLVNLKREVGDFSTLANPRIRVKNREKAKVLVGDKIPVISTVTGQAGFVSDNISYLDVGLKLEVEPTIYADDDVGIKVTLEVSSLGTAIRTSAGALAYQIGTRNATTSLRLRDGETQLLAGLISRDERTSASRLPGAGDLPVLGRLFSSTADNAQRTELVLAVTPRVLRNVQRPTATEAEVWIGTEARPGLRLPKAPAAVPAARVPDTPAAVPSAPVPAGPADAEPVGGAGASPAAQPTAASVSDAGAGSAAQQLKSTSLAWQAPAEVRVGELVTLRLAAEHAKDLRALRMDLAFDPALFAFVGFDEGDLLAQGGVPTTVVATGQPSSGAWSASVLRRPATGAQGAGLVASLRLRALKAGETQVAVRAAHAVSVMADVSPLAPPPAARLRIAAKP